MIQLPELRSLQRALATTVSSFDGILVGRDSLEMVESASLEGMAAVFSFRVIIEDTCD